MIFSFIESQKMKKRCCKDGDIQTSSLQAQSKIRVYVVLFPAMTWASARFSNG